MSGSPGSGRPKKIAEFRECQLYDIGIDGDGHVALRRNEKAVDIQIA